MVIISICIVLSCHSGGHPSDAALQEIFRKEENTFRRLVEMLTEDQGIVRLTNDDVFYLANSNSEISHFRWLEYRELLKKANVKFGVHRDNPSSLRFIMSIQQLISRSEKSLIYSSKNLDPEVDSIDEIAVGRRSDLGPVYRRISKNWYCVYEIW